MNVSKLYASISNNPSQQFPVTEIQFRPATWNASRSECTLVSRDLSAFAKTVVMDASRVNYTANVPLFRPQQNSSLVSYYRFAFESLSLSLSHLIFLGVRLTRKQHISMNETCCRGTDGCE